MTLSLKRAAGFAILCIQLCILPALAALEYAAEYNGGLMHYMYYKKIEYMDMLYSAHLFPLHAFIFAAGFILLRMATRTLSGRKRIQRSTVYAALFIFFTATYFSAYIQELNTAAYILMATETIAALEIMRMRIAS